MKITYRKGYPSVACIEKLLDEFFKDINGYFPFMSESITYTGRIVFQRTYMNEYIDSLVGFLTEKGIEVEEYQLYESHTTGHIKFNKKQ